jgi:hypothetical protein
MDYYKIMRTLHTSNYLNELENYPEQSARNAEEGKGIWYKMAGGGSKPVRFVSMKQRNKNAYDHSIFGLEVDGHTILMSVDDVARILKFM